ncbi:elongation of very long chain fatty acids protein 1-like [Frieseomelitta varia]|uniref:elongation of very long chain fatty acids protein 1-like n=1 Tax=Frieseomelitta varia TaxID=561572 RepID=UPI001CB6A4D9|nr:elongation of very long chain fatty acids protein 1-like [Frieseomelitta varia]
MEQSAGSSGCFFLQNPAIIILVFTFAYVYFVLRCGQKCMRDKSAYTLHTFTRCYNIFQIVSNGLFAYHILKHGLHQFLLPGCDVPDSSVPLLAQTKTIEWCILCSKFVDYIETIILLLEKRQHEITLLHLYRRISAPWITWFTMKYFIVGSSLTFTLLNCSVHAMKYTSNLLSSFEPLSNSLITIVEMAQLSISILYALQSFFLGCSISVLRTSVILADLLINLVSL